MFKGKFFGVYLHVDNKILTLALHKVAAKLLLMWVYVNFLFFLQCFATFMHGHSAMEANAPHLKLTINFFNKVFYAKVKGTRPRGRKI